MTEILVTGAEGFIGRHLVSRLLDAGHSVHAASRNDGDVVEPATWARYPDAGVTIHLAGRSFVPDSWSDPWSTIRSNLLGTVAALDNCRARGSRLVFLSSYMYGHAARLPIAEDAPARANNPYGLSKKLAEDACVFYAERFGIKVAILRPFNVYGLNQGEDFLVPTILRQLRTGREVRVKDLEPRRDYVYVRDVVEAIVAAAIKDDASGIFNIGSGCSHSVADLIDTMQQIWGTSLPVVSDGERRKDEVMDAVADISRANDLLKWKPLFSLSRGLADMRAQEGVR